MTQEVYGAKKIVDFLEEGFIFMKVDCEKGDGIKLAKKNSIKHYPTTVTYNSDGKELARRVGAIYKPAEAKRYFKTLSEGNYKANEVAGPK